MLLHFPDLQQKIEKTSHGRFVFPDGEWTVLPSRQTFLVPVALPARVLRRLGDAQIRSLVFDRIPLPSAAAKAWLLVPRLHFFSRGQATAWAVVAPLSVLPAEFDRCLPEDLLLAEMVWDNRNSRGGWIVLDAPGAVTLIGVGPNAKTGAVWKQLSASGQARVAAAVPPAMTEFLGHKSSIFRLNAGGSFGPALEKYGNVVTEDAAAFLAGRVQNLLGQKEARAIPNILTAPSQEARDGGSSEKIAKRGLPASFVRALRLALLSLSLILPLVTLGVAGARLESVSSALVNTMVSGYENRLGTKIPESLASNPLLALQDKSRFAANADRQTTVSLQTWLSLLDRLSTQSAKSDLQLDLVSLDVVRIEIRGNAADQKSVGQWVSSLSSDSMLVDVALVESKLRMSDRRMEFTVRARMRIISEGSAS